VIREHTISELNLKHTGSASSTIMNTQSSSMKTWIWIIIIIVIGGGIFFYFNGKDSSSNSGGIGVTAAGASSVDQTQVLSLLNQIRKLNIDSELFSDPAYTKLYDYSVDIPDQTVGRSNPFAPLPGEAAKSKPAAGATR